MRARGIDILVLLMLLCLPVDALAGRIGLLQLGRPRQILDLNYRYDGSQSKNRSLNQHHLFETYSFQVDYAAIKPQILRGKLGLGLRFDQSSTSSTGSPSSTDTGLGFLYELDGTFISLSPTPVDFQIISKIEDVPRSFGSGYELRSDTYSAGLTLKNRMLPLHARVSKTTTETSGLEDDRRQTHEVFSLNGNHMYRDLSNTMFTVVTYHDKSTTTSGADQIDSTNYDFLAENYLTWGRHRTDNSLRSWVRYVEQTGTYEYRSMSWSESLLLSLGRALKTGASYSFDRRSNTLRENKISSGHAWIQHRLFESLTTQLDVQGRKDISRHGSEQQVSGRASLSYSKRISPQARLLVSAFEGYGVTDRNLSTGTGAVFDEVHAIDQYQVNLFIPLTDQNVLPESITVRNQNPLRRPDPYVLGVDYVFDIIAGRKGIRLIGADFRDSDILLVTYDTSVSPSITYATDAQGVFVDLTTFQGKYRYYASWQQTRQKLLSGREDQINLVASSIEYLVGIEQNLANGGFSAEYTRTDSDTENHQAVRATARHRGPFRGGTYTVYLSDIYTMMHPNSTTAGAVRKDRYENLLNAGGIYTRGIFRNGILIANVDYSHVSGDAKRDDIGTGLALRWNYGKLLFTLQAQMFLRNSPGVSRQEERVRINLTRYF